jgi:hypothetical protein
MTAAGAALVVGVVGLGALVALPGAAEARQQKAGVTIPADLLGTWRWTTVNGGQIVDSTTGNAVDDTGGMSVTFTFTKDGRYKKFFYTKMQSRPGWVTTAQSDEEGVVTSFDGSSFTIRPTKSWYKGSDTMKGTKVDRAMRPDEMNPATYRWRWETGADGKRKLMIGPSERSMSHFQPAS